jgi:hypothetical protein
VAPPSGYFVDAAAGNDANAGTPAAPFRTLAKVGTLRLTAGQGIYLHCGSVWRESLTLSQTQLVDGSKIGVYGDNCNNAPPRITGAMDLSGGWTLANGVWSRSVPAGTPKMTRLFVNGAPLGTAQWPTAAAAGTAYALASASSPTSMMRLTVDTPDRATLASRDLVGATLRVRNEPWMIEDRPISGYDANSGMVSLGKMTTYAMGPQDGYVLMDKLWMLDAPGEFYHDTAANKVYLIAPTADVQAALNNASVEAPVRDYAMTISGRDSITIQGLAVDMARLDGVTLSNLTNATVTGLTAAHNGRTGVHITTTVTPPAGAAGTTLAQSAVMDNVQSGIDASTALAATIKDTSVTDTGTRGWTGPSLAALWSGDGAQVLNNTITNAAFQGIRFSGTGGSAVTNNLVTNYCLTLSDCGGIYTYNYTNSVQRTANQNSTVTGNQVGAARPNTSGTHGSGSTTLAGIYLDDFTIGTTVRDNIVAGTPIGVYVHNGSNHVVDGNRLWLNNETAIYANMDRTDKNAMVGNIFSNNQLVPATALSGTWPALPQATPALGVRYATTQATVDDIVSGSNTFTGNQFFALQTGSTPAAQIRTSKGTTNYTMGGWRTLAPNDTAGTAPAMYRPLSENYGAELQGAGAFSSTLAPWTAWYSQPQGGSATVQQGLAGCTDYCGVFTAGSSSDMLYGSSYAMTSGKMYSVRYNATLTGTATLQPPNVTQSASPWGSLTGSDGMASINATSGVAGETISAESWIHASMTTQARTNLRVATPGVAVAFDDVSVRAVTNYKLAAIGDWAGVAQAAPTTPMTVTCATFGWSSSCTAKNLAGQTVTFPVTIPADGAQLFVRTDSKWKQ